MQETIWEDIPLQKYPSLTKNIETEILVIGGGICGILCAYRLAKEGKKVVLVEKERLCSQRTKKTTAVITALQDVLYSDLVKNIGFDKAKLYLQANLDALEEYKKLSEIYDFDFEQVPSYKYAVEDKNTLLKEVRTIQKLGFDAEYIENLEASFSNVGAIKFSNQGQMNPLKLIQSLVNEFHIYEHTKIETIQKNIAYTKQYSIQAQHIIVCTGYPFLKVKGLYFPRLIQHKSYVMVIKNPDFKIKGNSVGVLPNQLYFRTYQDYLLIGGNDQKTGKYKKGYLPLIQYIYRRNPNADIDFCWVNEDCISVDSLPYIGHYSKFLPHTYVATGFNLWGMTGSMLSSMVLTDMIMGRPNPYMSLFSPKRRTPFIPLLKNMMTAVKGLATPKIKRCGHLGCALNWNEKEQVYECPCHGSKYDKKGKVIYGPAQKNKEYK